MLPDQDIITQKRMQLEEFSFLPFLQKVIDDYGFTPFHPYVTEIRSRTVCYGRGCDEHRTDDAIHQLLVQDCLVAMVYERRTDLNFIEATYIICAQGIRRAKHRLKHYYKTLKHKNK